MIQRLLTIAAVAVTGLLAAPQAEAGHSSSSVTYRSGQASCGCPTYTQRYVRAYDNCRRPIYGYNRVALRHGSSCRHRGVQHSSHRYSRSPGLGLSIHFGGSNYRSRGYSSRGYSSRSSGHRNVGRSYGNSRGSSRTCR